MPVLCTATVALAAAEHSVLRSVAHLCCALLAACQSPAAGGLEDLIDAISFKVAWKEPPIGLILLA